MNDKNFTRTPTPLEKFIQIEDDGVFYIGHASALVRINKKFFLFDPVWKHKPYGEYWTFFPQQINCDQVLDKVSAVFISHIHEDHVCDDILSRVNCPIYIMDGRGPSLMSRVAADLLAKPFQWFKIDEGIEAYFVPHSFNSIDSSVFIRSKDYCVYVGSDNFLSKELILKVAPDVPRVDTALVPYAFVHWYPHLVFSLTEQEREAEVQRLNRQSLDQARDFITGFRPNHVIPFGNNLFYAAGKDHFLNRSLAKPTDLVPNPMGTGEFILKGEIKWVQPHNEKFESRTFSSIEPHPARLTDAQVDRLLEKLKKAPSIKELHQLIINGVIIDLERPGFAPKYEAGIPSTEFNFAERELNKWLDGEITFEQAIGTRRFQCYRRPEKYNLKVFEFMNNYL